MEFRQQQNITLLNDRYDVDWDDFSKVDGLLSYLRGAQLFARARLRGPSECQ